MISRLLFVAIFACSLVVQAQEQKPVTFTIKNAGINVKGSFASMNAQVAFDPENLSDSFFLVKIPVNTIKTGIKGRDKHLKKSKYFATEQYPEISFKSTSISKTTEGFLVKGNLTVKATTKLIEITFVRKAQDGITTLEGSLELNRRDYAVGKGSLILGNQVKIKIHYSFDN